MRPVRAPFSSRGALIPIVGPRTTDRQSPSRTPARATPEGKPPGASRRWPHALLPRFVTYLHPVVHARVGPDVHEAVGAAELHAAREHDGRELRALADLRLPALRRVG